MRSTLQEPVGLLESCSLNAHTGLFPGMRNVIQDAKDVQREEHLIYCGAGKGWSQGSFPEVTALELS